MKPAVSLLGLSAFLTAPLAAQPATSPPPDEAVITLSAFEVAASEDEGYASANVVSGSRIREAIKDTPLNISVLTEEFLRDLKTDTLMDALQYTAGVNFEDERNMSFQVRGYRVWIPRRNGFRTGLPYVQTANVERVEFIRGPASVLYGEGDPGGIINTITKRPKPRARTTFATTVGSWDYFKADLDWNRPLSARHGIFARLNLSYRNNETWVDFESNETTLIAPSLLWRLSERTSLYFDYEYVNTHRNPPGFIPRYSDPATTSPFADRLVNFWNPATQSYEARRLGDAYPNNRFFNYRLATENRSFNFNGPLSFSDGEAHIGQIELHHQFTPDLQARVGYSYVDRTDLEYRFGGAGFRNENGFFAGNSINAAQAYLQNGRTIGIMGDTNIRGYGLQADLVWQKRFDGWENKLLLFGETNRSFDTSFRYNAGRLPVAERLPAPSPLNLNPNTTLVYNDPPWSPEKLTLNNDTRGESRAFAVTNQAAFFEKRWRVMAGARYQRTGTNDAQSRWTPQYGTTFAITPDLTAYALVSEAFTQQFQRRPEDNEFADPVLGKGREIGLKFDLFERRLSGMVAFFHTERINQWSSVPLDPPNPAQVTPDRQSVYRDEESEGMEIDLIYSPVKNWQITAGYAYTKSAVTANPAERDLSAINWPSIVGAPLANTPKHRFNLWNRFNVTQGRLTGAYVGGGVIYAGERSPQVDGRNLFWTLPSYVTVDLLAGYRHKIGRHQVDYSLRVENAFDENYVRSQQAFGAPRNFKFTVRTTF